MNYTEFKDYVIKCFKELMGSNARINILTIIGNNDCEKEALIILENNHTISPTIYIRDYYEEYLNGVAMGDIIVNIYSIYKEYIIRNDIASEVFYDFEKIKNSIVFKLVNKKRNEKMLKDVPHFDVLDLSMVFYFLVNTENIQNATAMIHNEHLKMWNVSRDEIYKTATENTPRLLGYSIRSIDEIIKEYFDKCTAEGMNINMEQDFGRDILSGGRNDIDMYVLTNHFQMNGAACMLYEKPLKWFSQKMKADIYIIPSSVHEVLMLSADNIGKDELNFMVEQVNKQELAPTDILSDHVYMYDRKRDEIIIP